VGVGVDFVLKACDDSDAAESLGDLDEAESDACSLIDLSSELNASVSCGAWEARNRLDANVEGPIRRGMLDLDALNGMPDIRTICQQVVSYACDEQILYIAYSEGPESHCLTSGSRFTPYE
jgi:hypothetical protein